VTDFADTTTLVGQNIKARWRAHAARNPNVVLEQSPAGEEIVPVVRVALLTGETVEEHELSGAGVGAVDRDAEEVDPGPPEADHESRRHGRIGNRRTKKVCRELVQWLTSGSERGHSAPSLR
jgi:hypothetical protein